MQPKAQCNSVTVGESAKFRKFDLHKLSQPIPWFDYIFQKFLQTLLLAF